MPLRVDVTVGAHAAGAARRAPRAPRCTTPRSSRSARPRAIQFESYQPTSVLAGQELTKELEATLGATLRTAAGRGGAVVWPRAIASGDSRPRWRSRADPEGRPASRRPVEPVRRSRRARSTRPAPPNRGGSWSGDAALRRERHRRAGEHHRRHDPHEPGSRGRMARFVADFATAATDLGGAADVRWGNGQWALHSSAAAAGATATSTRPKARSRTRNPDRRFANVGAAWTGTNGFFGASYGYDDTKYGVPVIEEGQVELTPRRHILRVKAGASALKGLRRGVQGRLRLAPLPARRNRRRRGRHPVRKRHR